MCARDRGGHLALSPPIPLPAQLENLILSNLLISYRDTEVPRLKVIDLTQGHMTNRWLIVGKGSLGPLTVGQILLPILVNLIFYLASQ